MLLKSFSLENSTKTETSSHMVLDSPAPRGLKKRLTTKVLIRED